jgi:hypothetical protein
MAEETDSNSAKKRRIIHWNPDAGRAQESSRWTWKRILLWSVGGFFGLLFAAAIVIRGIKLVLGPDVFSPKVEAVAGTPSVENASSAFVSRAKAEQMHELASKSLRELRRVPVDHPVQLQQMVLMEKSLNEGEALLGNHDFAKAFALFETLRKDTDAFSNNVKIKGEAKQGYDKILLRIKDLELARSLAPGALEAAFESAGTGRQLLNDGNFTGAKKAFDEGEVQLKKAEQLLADYVRENLLNGQRLPRARRKRPARRSGPRSKNLPATRWPRRD